MNNRFGLTETTIEKINSTFSSYPQIEEVLLYGSRAKGNYKSGSDIDLTIKGKSITNRLMNQLSLSLDNLLLPYTIDLSIYHHIDNPDLIDHINRNGIIFYQK